MTTLLKAVMPFRLAIVFAFVVISNSCNWETPSDPIKSIHVEEAIERKKSPRPTEPASQENILIEGLIKDYCAQTGLEQSRLTIVNETARVREVKIPEQGQFKIYLEYYQQYLLIFSSQDYVSKTLHIDATGIPEAGRYRGYSMSLGVSLLKRLPNVDYRVLKKPIGYARYSYETGVLVWDQAKRDLLKPSLDDLAAEYEEALKAVEPEQD